MGQLLHHGWRIVTNGNELIVEGGSGRKQRLPLGGSGMVVSRVVYDPLLAVKVSDQADGPIRSGRLSGSLGRPAQQFRPLNADCLGELQNFKIGQQLTTWL
jgi:hypothetical protein